MSWRVRYHCMISTCDWHYERDSMPDSAELERALMFGPADASLDRAARTNAILRKHFETHTLKEWVAEVSRERQRANKAEFERDEARAAVDQLATQNRESDEVHAELAHVQARYRQARTELDMLRARLGVGVVPTVQTDSVIVKLSDGEVWVPEDCTVPDEVLRALNAPTRDPREGVR